MPGTINGIGTWYYGKENIHRVRGQCQFCNSIGDLASYDTTNYVVFVFIPIIPLGKMRILNECPVCQKHLRMPQKEWIEQKAEAIRTITSDFREKPNDPEVVTNALGVTLGYQDEELFRQVADAISPSLKNDPTVQTALGDGYAYFSDRELSLEAYRKAVEIEETDERREQLAVAHMKNNDPERAEPLLSHIDQESDPPTVGLLTVLIESYQAEGMHHQALQVFERLEKIAPEETQAKEFQKLKKRSEKHLETGKQFRSEILTTSKKAGTEKGSGGWLPKLIFPALLAIALVVYFSFAVSQGKNQEVVLLNGLPVPYSVTVNDTPYSLNAGTIQRIQIPQGEVHVKTDPGAPLPCDETTIIKTPFWKRPFLSRVFVINPDRLGVIEWSNNPYFTAQNPNPPESEWAMATGNVFHEYRDIDYAFKPLPREVDLSSNNAVKWKSALSHWSATEFGLESIASSLTFEVPDADAVSFLKRALEFEKDSEVLLQYLAFKLPEKDFAAFLKQGLDAKPIPINMHRMYQSQVARIDPDYDLMAEYQQRLAGDEKNAPLLYLTGRIADDPRDGVPYFERAIAADQAFGYAYNALGYHYLCVGDFDKAFDYCQQAGEVMYTQHSFLNVLSDTLLATGKYDEYIALSARLTEDDSMANVVGIQGELRALCLQKKFDEAQRRIETAVAKITSELNTANNLSWRDSFRKNLDAVVHYAKQEIDQVVAIRESEQQSLQANLPEELQRPSVQELQLLCLKSEYNEALEKLASLAKESPEELRLNETVAGVLFLEFSRRKEEQKTQKVLELLTTILDEQGDDKRYLANVLKEEIPIDVDRIKACSVLPEGKRVLMSVLAARFPETAEALNPLAVKMNYNPTFPYWYLREFLPSK